MHIVMSNSFKSCHICIYIIFHLRSSRIDFEVLNDDTACDAARTAARTAVGAV